jgi:hypothetical protein
MLDQTVHRFWVSPDRQAALLALGLDPSDAQETLQLLGAVTSAAKLNEFLNFPFRRRVAYVGPPLRFSDANLPAFYSAIEPKTAEDEAAPRDGYTCYKDQFTCKFGGRAKDVLNTGWAFLTGKTSNDLQACLNIARRAKASGIQAIKTPSAQRLGGICVPVWDRLALSEPQYVRTVRYVTDVTGRVVNVEEVQSA